MKKTVSLLTAAVMAAAGAAYLPQSALHVQAADKTYGVLEYRYDVDKTTVYISGCDPEATKVFIPSKIEGLPVTRIGNSAFMGCESLESVTIPDSVTKIDDYVFQFCPVLTEINIPSSVTVIGDNDFYQSAWLEKKREDKIPIIINHNLIDWNCAKGDVTVPVGTTRICGAAFSQCSGVTSVTVQDGVKKIGKFAFSSCPSLKSVELPESVDTLSEGVFKNCPALTSIHIPDAVREISHEAFLDCSSLTEITLPAHLLSIGKYAFSGCIGLSSVEVPDTVYEIGENAFNECINLKSVRLPKRITELKSRTFYKCGQLTSVTVPEGVEKVSSDAFGLCDALTKVIFQNPECEIDGAVVYNKLGGDDEEKKYIYQGEICGFASSAAQAFAETYGFNFREIGMKGDVNLDGASDVRDAQNTLLAFLNTLNGEPSGLSDAQFAAADVDGNSNLTALDAQYILLYYLYYSILGENVDWNDVIPE